MYSGIIYYFKSPSGKYYIGQTIDELRRFQEHMFMRDGCPKLNNAIKKYGISNLKYKIILKVISNTKEELSSLLNSYEIMYIKLYNSFNNGYNCNKGGGAQLGFRFSKESREKISNSLKGNIPWNKGKTEIYSKETLDLMSNKKKGFIPWNKGKKVQYSDEMKLKLSIERSGIEPWNKGLKNIYSDEVKTQMSISASKKFKEKYSKPLAKYTLDGELIKEYEYYADACKEENIPLNSLKYVLDKKTSHIYNGFIWKYIEDNSSTTILKGSTSDEDGNNEIPEKE